jgi:hypothetical protein
MNSDEQDIYNRINRDKSADFSFIGKELLNSVYNKVVNKAFRINENNEKRINMSSNKMPNYSNKADIVMQNDRQLRDSVQNLIISLVELGDKEIAIKLLGEHILMMSQAFKEFDK